MSSETEHDIDLQAAQNRIDADIDYLEQYGSDAENDNCPCCPMCGGDGRSLGQLGNLHHFRCWRCGWDFALTAEEVENLI